MTSFGYACHDLRLSYVQDVAIKIFTEQEYSPDLLADFRKEVN